MKNKQRILNIKLELTANVSYKGEITEGLIDIMLQSIVPRDGHWVKIMDRNCKDVVGEMFIQLESGSLTC